jgi:AraC-like DNA-binding protein
MLENNGTVSWYCTTKLPLYGSDGAIAGLMGITRPIKTADPRLNPFAGMMPVVDYISRNLRSEVTTDELARLCHLSTSQFRRRFKHCFDTSPRLFILKLRIQTACHLLPDKTLNIGQVSEECGFQDQNYFTRQFRRFMGTTPTEYRAHRNRRPG